MTPAPHTIGVEQPISVAAEMMHTHKIRHLPVLSGGKVVGIVSERDLQLLGGLPKFASSAITVEEAMSQDIYAVDPATPLHEVATEMAAHKYGAALVTEHDRAIGVFTTIDALRALAKLIAPAVGK